MKIISGYVFNSENRQEILHDIWLKVFININRYDRNRKFSIWLSVITINTCKTWIKKNIDRSYGLVSNSNIKIADSYVKVIDRNDNIVHINKSDDIFDLSLSGGEFEEALCNRYFLETVLLSIDNKTHLLAWKLKYINELSLEQISEVIGKPQSTVKNWIYRVTKKIYKVIIQMQQ
jgi:RNA polymerase sigma-70 factor (ECF subfamily)